MSSESMEHREPEIASRRRPDNGPLWPHPQTVADREANIAAALEDIGKATFSSSVSFTHRRRRFLSSSGCRMREVQR